MKINRLLILFVMVLQGNINAQNTEIIVWESGVPNTIDAVDYKEIHDIKLDRISKVTQPTLTVFKPKNPNGTSVVTFPGGGYAYLVISKEGYKVAEWLNTLGIDDKGVVVENSLQYLLALKQHKVPAELHVYQNGDHGFGLGKVETSDTWTIQCEAWLRLNRFIKQ